jgi:hypothetical protein
LFTPLDLGANCGFADHHEMLRRRRRSVRFPDGMLTAALRFENVPRRGGTWPVAYPADNQTDVPLDYGAEFPNPIPNHGTGGYAITLQFPAEVSDAGELSDGDAEDSPPDAPP